MFRALFWLISASLLAACGRGPLEQHRAIAAETLARTGAPDFVDASTADYAAIAHGPSGMLCLLPENGVFEFDVFPASAANAGAQCTSANGETATAMLVVQFGAAMTLDAAYASAVGETAGRAAPAAWSGRPSAADRSPPEGLPHYRIGRFEIQDGETARYLRIAVSEARGWYLQQIVSAPIAEAEAAEARAGQDWRTTLQAFAVATADAR